MKLVGGVTVGVATTSPNAAEVDALEAATADRRRRDFIVPNFLAREQLLRSLFA